MRQVTFIVIIAVCFGSLNLAAATRDILGPGLQDRMNQSALTGTSGPIQVVVFLEDDPISGFTPLKSAPGLNRGQRIKRVLGELMHESKESTERIHQFLIERSSAPVIRHWIVPAFTASLTPDKISELTAQPGVRSVVENLTLDYIAPVSETPASVVVSSVSSELMLLKVPTLWQQGLKGAGRLICSFDTGVDWDHPALVDQWRGNTHSLSSSWFSKVAPDELPYDAVGHGTHTMSLMVGAADADTFGVAPEAEWITAGVIDQGRPLQTTLSDIIEAFQWALNPDGDTATTDDVPDVILNSWGVPKGLFVPCDEMFTHIVDVVEAAGIVTVFAAGNEGPDPMTLRSPADQASTPINSLAVGAVNIDKQIANFSSRGPSSCDQTQIKPEIVAPGVGVRSSQNGGGYTIMSGTSMAAPFIAGLVALMRQYNPDATVEEIKLALLLATEDLGAAGEDNTYGHGLVDASRLLGYLPTPVVPNFKITSYQVTDDGIAWPGEDFGMEILLNNPAGNVSELIGVLESSEAGVSIMSDTAIYLFGVGGSSAQSLAPYQIRYDSSFCHGQTVNFMLQLQTAQGSAIDSIAFVATVGVPPSGQIADHNSSRIGFSVSDFAQFGFGTGSLYNAGGEGFRIDGSDNLLYEAGIVLGRNALQLSSSIRDAQGLFQLSDYEPTVSLSASEIDGEGGQHVTAGYADTRSEIPIPIELTQETISYADDGGFMIFKFQMRNMTPTWLTGLHFGFLTDFDMDAGGDRIVYDNGAALMYQSGGTGPLVGLVALKNLDTYTAIDNGATKRGFSRADKFDLIASTTTEFDSSLTGDLMMFLNSGSFAVQAWDSNEVVFAIVVGTDLPDLYDNAQRARERFDLATAVDEDQLSSLPSSVTLHQNYPNPFNPTTTISFSLSTASDVSLVVYNALGQQVKQLVVGRLPAGSHEVTWDATNARGIRVASGVYFYRLSNSETSHSRKMLLLK